MGKDWLKSEQRKYFRVSVGRLPSLVKDSGGTFEVVDKSIKPKVPPLSFTRLGNRPTDTRKYFLCSLFSQSFPINAPFI
jgi:hypothetical protein